MRTDFDFHQLSHFLAVAKMGNLTQAAAEIGISQPALSRSIQKLERTVGEPLFERQPRGVKLTEIGSITPPVGLNVFAMKGVIPKEMNISLETIFKGVWPFCLCDFIVLVFLIMFPQISLWLPNLLLD